MTCIPSSLLSSRVFTWLSEWVGSTSGQLGQKIAQRLANYKCINLKVKAMIPHFPLKTTQELQVEFHAIACLIHSRACPNPWSPLSEV